MHSPLKQSWKSRASGQSRTAHLLCAALQAWQTLVAGFTESNSGTELEGCSSRRQGVGQLSRWVTFKKWASDTVPLKRMLTKMAFSYSFCCLLRSGSVCKVQRRFHWGSKPNYKKGFLVSVAFLSQRRFKYLTIPRSGRQVSVSRLPSCAWKPLSFWLEWVLHFFGFVENSPESQGMGQVEWESWKKYGSRMRRGKAEITVTHPVKFH